MKTEVLLSALDALDKKQFIVKIPTIGKKITSKEFQISNNSDLTFHLEINLEYVQFGQEVGIKNKKVKLIRLVQDEETVSLGYYHTAIIEDFFRNYIIPDIQLTTRKVNRQKTTA